MPPWKVRSAPLACCGMQCTASVHVAVAERCRWWSGGGMCKRVACSHEARQQGIAAAAVTVLCPQQGQRLIYWLRCHVAHKFGAHTSALGPSQAAKPADLQSICAGTYETYEGSPASKGQLQHDLWGVKPPGDRWNWDGLRADIAKQGLRNSLLVAPMPTASTSQARSAAKQHLSCRHL